MAGLPAITAELGVVKDPELKFSDKGSTWMKLRCKAAARIRSSDGSWTNGTPLFIDVVISGKYAENLAESIGKGDTIIVHGELEPNEWTDKEGNVRNEIRIRAEYVGPSTKWNPARTPTVANDAVTTAVSGLGATIVQDEIAPF